MQLHGMAGKRGMLLWKESMCSPFGMQCISLKQLWIFSSFAGHLLWPRTDGSAGRQAMGPLNMSASTVLQQLQNRCLVICARYLRCCCYLITCSSRVKYLPFKRVFCSKNCVCLLWTWFFFSSLTGDSSKGMEAAKNLWWHRWHGYPSSHSAGGYGPVWVIYAV